MRTQIVKRVVSCIAATLMLATCLTDTAMAAKWNVTPSKTDYSVDFDDSSVAFLCNKETIGSKVGTEYYMTYTVESITAESYDICGVMGTNQPKAAYPYISDDAGGAGYLNLTSNNNLMAVEGYTYFLKFTITEDGYNYRVAWGKGDDAQYIKFGEKAGEVKSDFGYFGVYFNNKGMTGRLSKVRCYDKKGNDLGVQATPHRNISIGYDKAFEKDTEVNHSYTIEAKDVYNVAFSNLRVPTSDKVYIEYKVKSSKSKVYQSGIISTTDPTRGYPYEAGQMQYREGEYDPDVADNGPMLVEGAEYLIIIEKKDDCIDAIVQQTLNGKVSFVYLDAYYGTYNKKAQFFSLWFGGGPELLLDVVLEDFKIYDSNKNNLAVQTNKGGCTITHHGELEDYAGCESVYYCEEDDSLYALYKDKTLKFTKNDETKEGTYRVQEGVLTVTLDGEEKQFNYMHQFFKDESGQKWLRLHSYKVTFETNGGTEVDGQVLNAENGYKVMRPNDPTMDGNTFKGWYTSDGEEFDFDQFMMESVTLYAKWADTKYASTLAEINIVPYVSVGVGVLIILAAVICGIIIIARKGKQNAGNKKE